MRSRSRAVNRNGFCETVYCFAIFLLFDQDEPQVEFRVEILRVQLYGQLELFGCLIKLLELKVLHSEVVMRAQVIGVNENCLLEVFYSFLNVALVNQLAGLFIFFLCRGRRFLIELSRRNCSTAFSVSPALAKRRP